MRMVRSCVAAATVVLAVTLTACSGGGTPAPANPSAGGGGAVASGAASQAPQATGGSSSASPSRASNGGGFAGDPCSLVSAADVSGIFGGSPSGFAIDENGACAFEINGTLKAGSGVVGGQCSVKVEDDHPTFDTAKMLFGDAVTKVDGLGADAWSYGGFVHVQIGTQDLIVGGVFVGNYDRALLASETAALTKLILTRI